LKQIRTNNEFGLGVLGLTGLVLYQLFLQSIFWLLAAAEEGEEAAVLEEFWAGHRHYRLEPPTQSLLAWAALAV
jgi:hypothetical protein